MPRRKKVPDPRRKPRNETPEVRAARIERMKAHAVKPGQILNPTGRNGYSMAVAMREFLEEMQESVVRRGPDGKPIKVPRFDNVMQSHFREIMKGNMAAIEAMYDRVGLPRVSAVRQEISGPGGGPVTLAAVAMSSGEKRAAAVALLSKASARMAPAEKPAEVVEAEHQAEAAAGAAATNADGQSSTEP